MAATDVKEERETTTTDLPGAFLHALNDEYAII